MEAIHIVTVEPAHPDLALLIRKLDTYLDGLFPPEEIFRVDFDDPKVMDITFVIAYLDDVPVGCGAINPLDKKCLELKRFYVEPSYRRHGVALQILTTLEHIARESNYAVMKLETGIPQIEAISFYEKHGFTPIDRYGEYVDCESSVCYEKAL